MKIIVVNKYHMYILLYKELLSNKIDWYHLSGNPNAISILEQNLDKVN